MQKIYLTLIAATFLALQVHSQNVGVGTATPGQKLDVNGWVRLADQTAPVPPNSHTAGSIRYNTATSTIEVNTASTAGSWSALAKVNDAVPAGAIVLWSGTKASIPSGWALCDGTAGTPNLLDKFILSVGVSAYTATDINVTGGNSSHTISVAELPAHFHTGTTDVSTPALTFTGTNATISHTGSFAGTAATITPSATFNGTAATVTPSATFNGTSATTSSTNTDHTHSWGGTWNSDQSNLGGSPYGDGNSSIYTDGVGYWSMSTGGGLGTTSTNIDHTHNWGGYWNNDNSASVAAPYGDGTQSIYSDGQYGIYGWSTSGTTIGSTTGGESGHNHSEQEASNGSGWGREYGTNGGYSSNYHGTNGSYGHTHGYTSYIPTHRHFIQVRTGGAMNSNQSHSHTVYNHRHWIQVRNSGAMSANASHNHTVTATGTISVTGASYTPAGTISVTGASYTPAGSVTVANASYTPAGTISGSGHTHTFTTGTTGSGTAVDIRPAFYRLAFIQKL
ncbi:MAG: hypothetical protein JWO03_792 [Bacteroidetes bacterium]|nr:hypothetical protein [Bacteroidota bacterium]